MKVRCINNYGVKDWLTVGEIYDVINGDIDYYKIKKDNHGDIKYYCKSRFEVVEEIEHFKAGDIVKVINRGRNYSGYVNWILEYAPTYKKDYENEPFDTVIEDNYYTVVTTGKHLSYNEMLVLIQDESTEKVFIIHEEGLKLYQRKTEIECSVPPKSFLHKKICDELNSIYEKKNSDYGDSFGKSFVEYGMTMPCIRLEDKLLRLKSLTVNKKDQQVNDESIEDTLLDLANYAIMSLMEMRGNKNEE